MPKLFKMAPHLDDVDGVARSMLRYVEMTEQSCKSLNCLVLAPKSHLFLAQKIWRQDCLPHYMILAILFSLNYIQLLLYYKFLLRSVLLFQARYFFLFHLKSKRSRACYISKNLLISKIADSRLVFTYLKLW